MGSRGKGGGASDPAGNEGGGKDRLGLGIPLRGQLADPTLKQKDFCSVNASGQAQGFWQRP